VQAAKKTFVPFEVSIPSRELDESSAWETVSAEDPDVDLLPSDDSGVVRIAPPALRRLGAEPLDIESFMRPQKPAIDSRRPTVPSGGAVDIVLAERFEVPRALAILTPPPVEAFTVPPAPPVVRSAAPKKTHAAAFLLAGAFFISACLVFGAAIYARHTHHAARGLKEARAAFANGDFDAASELYAELAQNPKTRFDAMIGLADVAEARGELPEATARYQAILATTPGCLPARVGLADATWDAHDYPSARMQYASIARSYPAAAFPGRVILRMK
jgi:hypothetical protein